MPRKKKEEKEVRLITYLIEKDNGKRFQIQIPENWKVTFGPAARGTDGPKSPNYKMPLALRFYENDTKQRAIFTDVRSFRDMSIPVREERIHTQSKEGHIEVEGKRKASVFRATTREWVDPDTADEAFPLLPTDDEMYNLGKHDYYDEDGPVKFRTTK